MATEKVTQQEFAQELQRLCSRQQTGTLIGNAAGGTLATVSLQDGVIVALGYRIAKGREALEQLRTLGDCKMSFRATMVREPQPDLPATDEIILLLGGDPSTPAAALSTREGTSFNQHDIQQRIEQEALTVLGPVAGMLCADYFSKQPPLHDATAIRNAVVAIASPVLSPQASEDIAARVLEKIGL